MVQAMLLNLLDLNLIKTRLTPLNIIKQQKTAALVWHLPSSLHLVGQEDWQTKRGEVVRVDLGVFLQKLLDSKTSRLFQISTSHHIPSVTQQKKTYKCLRVCAWMLYAQPTPGFFLHTAPSRHRDFRRIGATKS